MKIYDCFIFNKENLLAKLRFNILNKYVDFFVICEARQNHKGDIKNYNFDINDYKGFEEKIIYLKLMLRLMAMSYKLLNLFLFHIFIQLH